MINFPVLILNQNYEPLNICRARRAFVLIYESKAEMLENGSGFIRSVNETFPLPSVIRLFYMIKRPRPQMKVTKLDIFKRDQYTCQYCGSEHQQLTLDHIIPRYLGGQHTWENVVSACVHCNRRKAGKTPEQARMKLLHQPTSPRNNSLFYIPLCFGHIQHKWQKYIPQ